jgi:hypothetical protein
VFDWQAIAVALIILGALLYVARRALARLRSFRASRAACATGCGRCGDEETPAQTAPPLIQIAGPARRRDGPRPR